MPCELYKERKPQLAFNRVVTSFKRLKDSFMEDIKSKIKIENGQT